MYAGFFNPNCQNRNQDKYPIETDQWNWYIVTVSAEGLKCENQLLKLKVETKSEWQIANRYKWTRRKGEMIYSAVKCDAVVPTASIELAGLVNDRRFSYFLKCKKSFYKNK
ncbi:hypothetical protein NPIL_150651 [Nephila pilipes]|uniref:Uncharacterized protein n=1 Tax=Nephila pilipes TaxID=299642 RepID=A0A8X6TJY3_NEPPI|nr:hypothetical protein NPIL_150651 [Nephila pilipes]